MNTAARPRKEKRMENILCKVCETNIPTARAELGYKTCIEHSDAVRYVGFPVQLAGKTCSDILIHREGNKESIRLMRRAYRRGR